MDEPSVLDYLKQILKDWRKWPKRQFFTPSPHVDAGLIECDEPVQLVEETLDRSTTASIADDGKKPGRKRLPVAGISALALAILGQSLLEPPDAEVSAGLVFYFAAVVLLAFAWRREDAGLSALEDPADPPYLFRIRRGMMVAGVILAVIAFAAFGGGNFTRFNLTIWVLALLLIIGALYGFFSWFLNAIRKMVEWVRRPTWTIVISRWSLVILAAFLLTGYFRFSQLEQVPPEMVSDHAEKILDVSDVLRGEWHIFFPRNTGREAFQMYLTAAVVSFLGTGLSFLSLKIGTTLLGFLTLPYIYLIGKEMSNRRAGLYAMLLAGVGYWPNVISRVALRFTLYPFFAAPVLYYLIRGLRRPNPRDFILAGLFLGLGLHGYSPSRIVPLVVLVGVGLYLLHRQAPGSKQQAMIGLVIIVLISLVVFIPLFRYALQQPDQFSYRAFTRMGTLEKPLDAPAWEIFIKNMWNALRMFGWDNGEVWVVSIPHRPAFSIVSAALFHLGVLLVLFRYFKKRNWADIFLLLSIPLLLLPSVLSLAFPAENPILNRTAAALVPAFVLAGIALDGLLQPLQEKFSPARGQTITVILVVVLIGLAAAQDYNLVFQQYQQDYTRSAWNTSEMGRVIRSFSESTGSEESAWVLAYPYWVDTRLVGINAGYPERDTAIGPEQLNDTLQVPGPKLFLVNMQDQQGLVALQTLYPNGVIKEFVSPWEGKSFLIFSAASVSP